MEKSNIFHQFKALFIKQPKHSTVDTINETIVTTEPIGDFFFNDQLTIETNLAEETNHLRKLFYKTGYRFWKLGFKDGKINQNKIAINDIAKANILLIRDELNATYTAWCSQIENTINLKGKVYKSAESDYEFSDNYLKKLINRSRHNPRKFSRGLGLTYLLFALLLTIADIPLALKLTQIGFNLDIGDYELKDLFVIPWAVFTGNWEVFLVALGVSLCTIYVKIYYDEFVEKPLEHTIKEFYQYEYDDKLRDDDLKKIKRKHLIRMWTKSIILIFTLSTVVMLGKFRFETMLLEYSKKGYSLSAQPDPFVTQVTFIFITILFPLISGICASLGLNYIGNARDLKKAHEKRKTTHAAYLTASKELDDLGKQESSLKSALEWCRGDELVKSGQTLLLNFYNHGFQHGFLTQHNSKLGKDLFTQAEELRNDLKT